MYQKRRLSSAAAEFKWLCQTYGEECGRTANLWVDTLVHAASRGKPLDALSWDDIEAIVMDVLNDPAKLIGRWQHVIEQFQKASGLVKLKAFLAFLRDRRPPWESYVSMRSFTCLGGVGVELYAMYDINRVEKMVVFTKFDSCSADDEGSLGWS